MMELMDMHIIGAQPPIWMARILIKMQFMYVLARRGEDNREQMNFVMHMVPELREVTLNHVHHQSIPDSSDRRRICFVYSMS